jgi:hypothetical protein
MGLENFIPEIWANEIAIFLEKYLVYAQPRIVNRDYEGEISGAGDTVHISGIGPVTVGTYTKNTNINAAETLTDAQATLVIDQQKYFNFQVDSIDKAQQKPKIMQNAMLRAAYGMSDAIDQYVASLYTDAASANLIGSDNSPKIPNNTALDAQNCYNLLVDCAVKLTKSKVPMEGRWIIVPPEYYGLLLKEPLFIRANEAGTTEGLRNGIVGRAAGFDVLQSHNVPNTAAAKYKILFGIDQAITFATSVVDVVPYTPEMRFADAVKGLNVFGSKVVYPEMLGCMTVSWA